MSSQVITYSDLITSEHANRPKFVGVVQASAQPFVDLQNFLQSLPANFDIDTATNVRLDTLGQWVGLKRNLQAVAPGLHTQAPIGAAPLNDTDYSYGLHSKVLTNSWDGTIASAYGTLSPNFLGFGCNLFMIDNQNMTMTTAIAGNVPSLGLQAALLGGYLEVRPAAVLSDYYVPTAPGGALFGFDIENQFISGFDSSVWANKIG